MIKKTTILFMLAFGFCSTFAQELNIEWGATFDSKTEVQKILGFSEHKLVAYSMKGKKRYVGTYSEKGFKELYSGELILPKVENKKTNMLNMFVTGDHLSAVLYVINKKTKSFTLYSQKITLKGKLSGKPQKIYTSEKTLDKMKNMTVGSVTSKDEKKIIIYFNRMNKEKTTIFSDVIVLNAGDEMEQVSQSKYDFSVKGSKKEKVAFNLSFFVENNGNFSLLENIEVNDETHLKLHHYNKDGKDMGESAITSDDKILYRPEVKIKNNSVYIVGYYKNRNTKRFGFSGLYLVRLNEKFRIEKMTTSKFSDKFKENLYSKKKISKQNAKGKELLVPSAYRMNEVYVHSDGSLTVLSEYYQVVVTTQKNGTKTTTTTYGNILFFNLNKDGEIASSNAIKKYQQSTSVSPGVGLGAVSGGLSLFVVVTIETKDKKKKYWSYKSIADERGNVYLLFNDHFKNSADGENDLSKAMRNPKKSVPFLVTINKNGDFKKKAMVSSGDTETYIVPQVTYDIPDSLEFIIWGIWKKSNKFGLAKIEK